MKIENIFKTPEKIALYYDRLGKSCFEKNR